MSQARQSVDQSVGIRRSYASPERGHPTLNLWARRQSMNQLPQQPSARYEPAFWLALIVQILGTKIFPWQVEFIG